MSWCHTPTRCSVIGHATTDDLPCVRMPLSQWLKIVVGAILTVVLAWWFVVAMTAAMPASAHSPDELEDWRLDWTERVQSTGGLTSDLLDEWQTMADRHGCDWPGTECRQSTMDRVARSMPTARSTPTPPASGLPVGVEQWRSSLSVYAGWDVDRMLRIMRCESGGNPNAVSPTDDWGLLQIHAPIWTRAFGVTREQLLDPAVNIDIGWRVWSQQGYGAWVYDRG